MTISNIYLPADRRSATVLVDTAMAVDGKLFGDTSKYEVIAHVPALVVGRGSRRLLGLVSDDINHTNYCGFDALAVHLPGLIRAAARRHVDQLGHLDGGRQPELALVGRSGHRYAAVWYAAPDFEGVDQAPGLALRPCPPGYHVPPRASEPTTDDLIAVAEVQLAQTIADFGGAVQLGTGGDLIRIELGSDGEVSLKAIHRLGTYVGDPAAALARSKWWSGGQKEAA